MKDDKTIINEPKLQELIDDIKEFNETGDTSLLSDIQKNITFLAEKYNPINNKIDLGDVKVKWKIDPDINNLEKTKIEIEIDKNIKNDNVQLFLKINSSAESLISPINSTDFKAQIGAKIKL